MDLHVISGFLGSGKTTAIIERALAEALRGPDVTYDTTGATAFASTVPH